MIKKTESREISTQTSVMCSDGSFSLSSTILPWNDLLPGVQYYKEYSLSFLRLLLLVVMNFQRLFTVLISTLISFSFQQIFLSIRDVKIIWVQKSIK